MTNVINKDGTAGAHDIFQKRKKTTTVGHKQIQRNTLLGHIIYFRRKKDTAGQVTDSKKYTLGAHDFIYNVLLGHMSFTKICTSRACTIQ